MGSINRNSILHNAKGSLGGVTLSNTQSGTAIKNKVITRKANSSYQNEINNINLKIAANWKLETQANIDTWRAWLQFQNLKTSTKGNPIKSVYNAYYVTQFYSYWLTGSFISTPVFAKSNFQNSINSVSSSGSNLYLNFENIIDNTIENIIVKISPAVNKGLSNGSKLMKLLNYSTVTSNQQNIYDSVVARIGIVPTTGDKIFLSIILVNLTTLTFVTLANAVPFEIQ